jgi:Protein of unknown function (DUF4235)
MKILYKPFGIIAALIGAKIARGIFQTLWSRIDTDAPPSPTTEDASFPKVVGAAALEAATMAAVGAAIDRASARTFHHLTGIWPGPRRESDDDGRRELEPAKR